MNHIVFYGTLKRGACSGADPPWNRGLDYIGECLLPGRLYDMGRYPALKTGNNVITGELYRILDGGVLRLIDEHEARDDKNPSLPGFIRQPVALIKPKLMAWVYYYTGTPSEKLLIGSGKWSN